MKRKFMAVFATVLVLALAWVGAVYAQEDPGYPVETETPTETEVPTETEAPTETETPTETEAPVLTETPVPTESPTEDPTEMPTEEPTEEPTETPVEENPVCLGTRVHPVLAGLAIRYDVAYEEVVGMFCSSNLGVGEIALALATVQQAGGEVSLEDLLAQRLTDGLGWGEIWQNLGMTGNPDNHGLGNTKLEKVKDRNQFQDEIQNEGEDDQIQNEAEYQEQNGQRPETPPGLVDKDKDTGKPEISPDQEDDEGLILPSGESEDEKSNNGKKPDMPPGQSGVIPGKNKDKNK